LNVSFCKRPLEEEGKERGRREEAVFYFSFTLVRHHGNAITRRGKKGKGKKKE